MNQLKIVALSSVLAVSGCVNHPFGFVDHVVDSNLLSPAERCERMIVEKRADCRKKLHKQVDEMSQAMKKRKY